RELGVALRASGRLEDARTHWLQALEIFQALQATDADQIRALLGARTARRPALPRHPRNTTAAWGHACPPVACGLPRPRPRPLSATPGAARAPATTSRLSFADSAAVRALVGPARDGWTTW